MSVVRNWRDRFRGGSSAVGTENVGCRITRNTTVNTGSASA